jgi:hypothetical protein
MLPPDRNSQHVTLRAELQRTALEICDVLIFVSLRLNPEF